MPRATFPSGMLTHLGVTLLPRMKLNPTRVPAPDISASSVQALWTESNQIAETVVWLVTG